MNRHTRFRTHVAAVLLIPALLLPGLILGSGAPVPKPLTEDQKILHVLNRLGYGPRPSDVERVRAMGLQKYIDQQLEPASINDSALEARVKRFEVFNMSTAEVFAKYPNPGALLRQLEGGRVAQANIQQARQQMPSPGRALADAENAGTAERQERQQKLAELYRKYDLRPAGQLMPQIVGNRVLRAAYSERQLQEVMVDFWQNHFNVFAGKAAVRWYIPSYERDVLRKHALGNFKDLLLGTAQHPAMLFYLDNFESVAQQNAPENANLQRLERMVKNGRPLPQQARERLKRQLRIDDAQLDERLKRVAKGEIPLVNRPQGRGLNENYARELMELHTLGVDGGYTQKDIVEVAKAFTGWTIADPRGYRRAAASMIQGEEERRLARLQRAAGIPDEVESGEFYFNPQWHDNGEKIVLGQKVNEGGIKDGLKVIDILVNHPSTARHIARKLAVKFVNDKPSEALVKRIADAFTRSKGDMKTTLRALFTDKDFFAPENYRAKIKSPFELAVSTIRILGAETDARPAFTAMLNKLGETPYGYQAPTGYPDTAEDWVNTGALLERMNFAIAVASNRIPGTRVDLGRLSSAEKPQLLEKAIQTLLGSEISSATREALKKQMARPLPEVKAGNELAEPEEGPNMGGGQRARGRQAQLLGPSGDPEVFKAVSLVLGSPEFQRQ